MNSPWILVAIVLLPALGMLAGALLAEKFSVSPRTLSYAMHATAGMLLAVVGVRLIPQALSAASTWLVVTLFIAGGLFLVAIDWGTSLVQSYSQTEGSSGKSAWVIFLGVAVDYLTDGMIIASGSTFSTQLALLLGLGLLAADTPEAFSTVSSMRASNVPERKRKIIAWSFPVILLVGAALGYWLLKGQSPAVRAGVLAFTAGEVLTLAVSQIVPKSHKQWEGRQATLFLIGGFAVFVLLAGLIGAGGQGNSAKSGKQSQQSGTAAAVLTVPADGQPVLKSFP